jgi:Lrp/AsnC family transcriptional regulator, leucine-responsive regulatory protein
MAIRTNNYQDLDARDRHILALVQKDAKLSQAEIAKRVGLSTAAVNERLRKLDHSGVIRRFTAQVDPRALGVTITAFVEVFIEHPRFEKPFLERVLSLDEVQECHHITGEFSLLLKVRARDMEGLKELLLHQLNSMEGVRQTRTIMALSTAKEESYISTGVKGETS